MKSQKRYIHWCNQELVQFEVNNPVDTGRKLNVQRLMYVQFTHYGEVTYYHLHDDNDYYYHYYHDLFLRNSWLTRDIQPFLQSVSLLEVLSLHKKCSYSEFFWSVYSRIWTEYSIRMQENTEQKNSEYGHFLRSVSPSQTSDTLRTKFVEPEFKAF